LCRYWSKRWVIKASFLEGRGAHQQYDAATVKKELNKRQLYIRDFVAPSGLGQVLQRRLLDLEHISPNNWLNDTLWLALAYHTWRAPLIVNSNWWLSFGPDPLDPEPPVIGHGSVVTPSTNPTEALAKGEQGGGNEWIEQNPKGRERVDLEGQTKWEENTAYQVEKAAWILRRFAEFRDMLAK
jgi:carnitine O-acetyltransferase